MNLAAKGAIKMDLKDIIFIVILVIQTAIFIIQTFIFNKQKRIYHEQTQIINAEHENQSKASKVQAYYSLVEHLSKRDFYSKSQEYLNDKTLGRIPKNNFDIWEMTNMVCYLFNSDSIDFDLFKTSLRYHIDDVVFSICSEHDENPENYMDAITQYWRSFCKLNPKIERT